MYLLADMSSELWVKLNSENANIPQKGSQEAAGYDLYSAYDYTLQSQDRLLIHTDISIKVPENTYGRIAPRSGLALKHGIDVLAGVIDRDYRGNVGIILYNTSNKDFEIKKGDRVAQLIIEKIKQTDIHVVDSLDETQRNEGGFGSTDHGLEPNSRVYHF